MQTRSPHIKRDEASIKKLGSGEYGNVLRIKYDGEDPDILKFSESGFIAAKEFTKGIDWNEIKTRKALNAGIEAKMEKMEHDSSVLTKVLIMPFIAYADDGSSADVRKFFHHLYVNTNADKNPLALVGEKLKKAFDANNLAITLCQMAFSMKQELDDLHQAGYYHLDTAARNFLVCQPIYEDEDPIYCSVKITDFGLSTEIPVDKHGVLKLERTHVPIKWMDWRALKNKECTIATDYMH